MFHITQLLGIFHLQQIFEGDVQNPQKLGHQSQPLLNLPFLEEHRIIPGTASPSSFRSSSPRREELRGIPEVGPAGVEEQTWKTELPPAVLAWNLQQMVEKKDLDNHHF